MTLGAARAYEGVSELATPATITVQTTPAEDATVTALNKEKLELEIQQLKEQNEPDFFGWLRTNASVLFSTLVVVIGGLIGLWRWLGDRRDAQDKELKNQQNEREKRAEERFQSAVIGLGDEKERARIGAAILLRTFLRPGYEQFYIQTFDLAVHSPFFDAYFLYCNHCPIRVEVSFYDSVVKQVEQQVRPASEARQGERYVTLMRALEERLKPCRCGGSFRHDAPRRCFTCHAPVIKEWPLFQPATATTSH